MNTLLKDFKDRMHIFHDSEDDNLQGILDEAIDYIKDKTGLDDTDNRGRRLIMERGRYAYNDQLEFFEDNFLSELLGAAFINMEEDKNGE
ncbi:phage gp6-like head-tail connector protein [Tetragenococcus halophilus]|uniref:Phage gp6-like head-tail connector protein n=1 Tax=Tetragenococcus halophilus TaxID=51669 RepID=A0A3G5FKY7_TETHA|nr:head-tail connector protein [Tetragenococcus halophilus]AYW50798.1 phage gp6-like head-tail connector protein [Tetragenococcus halophilus]GBD64879.1 hypothetical protein TEHD23766T_2306 [Tetragenococcus halophilus subsp. flandriensis]GMA08864.1 hypothetical protein GCM10025886_20150 [Tetragenococcus halophilus subsp. flandriensis]